MSMHHARRRLAPLTDYEPTMDDTIAELAEHPRAVRIYMHLSVLHRYGFDPRDPDIIRRAVEAAETDRAPTPPAVRVPRHDPVIYYVRLGNRAKIGFTTDMPNRLSNINPEEILAVELGDRDDEQERHRLFKPLRVKPRGEWYRLEEPLVSYINTVAADFENAFGSTLDEWMSQLRSTPAWQRPTPAT